MALFCSGMEFPIGRPIAYTEPPHTLAADRIQLPLKRPPCVVEGQPLSPGQPLVDAQDGLWTPTCPVRGRVQKLIAPDPIAGPGTHSTVVVIEPSDEEQDTSLAVDPPSGRRFDQWLTALRQLGPWPGHDGRVGFEAQLDTAQQRPPATLICVGLDGFSPYPDRSSLLMSFPNDAVLGTLMIADLIGIKDVSMVAADLAAVVSKLRPVCRRYRLRLIDTHPVYPASEPTLVAWSHGRGLKLPAGQNPVEAGLMLISPWTAIRFARWVARRRIDLIQPVMIAWPERGSRPTVTYTFAGSPLATLHPRLREILSHSSHRVLLGHPMTGRLIAPAPDERPTAQTVVRSHATLISVLDHATARPAEPCISCGWCAETCPTGLEPIRLMDQCQANSQDARVRQQLSWCIDCGLCSYICPSTIPIAQTLHDQALQRGLIRHTPR